MDNPLLKVFETPYQSIPFSKIKAEHFIPAFKENIKNALEAIDKVAYQTAPPTFENTVEALQNVGELLERNSAILFNLNSAETSDAIQTTTQQASPLLTQFQNDVRLNQPLFERIKKIYENQDIKKDKLNKNKLIKYEDLLEILVISKLKCYYCKCDCLLMYDNVREKKQWTLDRLDNEEGHNRDNVVVSCLECNLKKGTMDDKKFKFAKQMRIIKKY